MGNYYFNKTVEMKTSFYLFLSQLLGVIAKMSLEKSMFFKN